MTPTSVKSRRSITIAAIIAAVAPGASGATGALPPAAALALDPAAGDMVRTAQPPDAEPPDTLSPDSAPQPVDAAPEDGPVYRISGFAPRYVREHAGLPSLDAIMSIEVTLGQATTGYIAPRPEAPVIALTLEAIAARPVEPYHASAVQTVLESIRDELVEAGLMGVFVAPDPRDLGETGQDVRLQGATELRLIMTTGIVAELRTLASGERIDARERINHPLHERIRARSPVRPYDEAADEVDRSLLLKGVLDDYIYLLSRHPGRRIDVAVAAALEPGAVALDYLVTENRPLVLYFQISNTGTKQTDYVRERFGLMHTQVTNSDDILSLDYITAGFDDDANAFRGSYEARVGENDRLRWQVFGDWSEFTADQVGFFEGDFVGEEWDVGAQIFANIHQERELFIDLIAGVRYLDVTVDNQGFAITGEEDFILPFIGVRLDRTQEWFSTQAQAIIEVNVKSTNDEDMEALGRTDPDDDWVVLRAGLSHSFFLEPALDRASWEDASTPDSSTLAHEIAIDLAGQYAFGDRLIPQAEGVAGGLYTVRGHPESAVAGDDVFVGRFEYRYHLPRDLTLEAEPRELFGEPFRLSPQFVYGRPDWDLVFKCFYDIGVVSLNDRESFESNETLMGAGVGLDFIFRRNLGVRLDWGFALRDVDSADVNAGSNRLHVVGTLTF